MTASIVQFSHFDDPIGGPITNQAPAFPSPVTKGNTVIVSLGSLYSGTPMMKVTDDQKNVYTILPAALAAPPYALTVAYYLNVPNTPQTVYVEFDNNDNRYCFIEIVEASGLTSFVSLGKSNTSVDPGPITVSIDDFLYAVAFSQGAQLAAPSGWTQIGSYINNNIATATALATKAGSLDVPFSGQVGDSCSMVVDFSTMTTPPPPPPTTSLLSLIPDAPAGLYAMQSSGKVTLNWFDNYSTIPTGLVYQVWKTDASAYNPVLVATVPAIATACGQYNTVDSGTDLVSGAVVYYWVVADIPKTAVSPPSTPVVVVIQ